MDTSIIVIAHNIRSAHNVGALLRTCDGLGIEKIFLTGYTPFPKNRRDSRLPHLAEKIHKQITKTALGSEKYLKWEQHGDVAKVIEELRHADYRIVGLEQTEHSTPLHEYKIPQKIALLIGEEVAGISPELLKQCDDTVEIPMLGQKESFNVVQAAAMTLYSFRFRK